MRQGIAAAVALAVVTAAPAAASADQGESRCLGRRATIVGTAGDDVVRGTDGPDIVAAGAGDDRVTALGGEDVICGGRGNDRLAGGGGSDLVTGGVGDDLLKGGANNDDLIGNRGHDRIRGGSGREHVFAGVGNDVIRTGSGGDHVVPGPGDDLVEESRSDRGYTVWFLFSEGGVNVDLVAGRGSGEGDDVLLNVRHVVGSDHDDVIRGTGASNDLTGRGGNDTIDGRGKRDVIVGGPGDDELVGGEPASDYVSYAEGPDAVRVDLASGTATGQGEDSLAAFERVIGSDLGDRLAGDAGPNWLRGGLGDDRLFGRAGDDLLLGGLGENVGSGGRGHDLCEFGTQADCEEPTFGDSRYPPPVVILRPRPGAAIANETFSRLVGESYDGFPGLYVNGVRFAVTRVSEDGCLAWVPSTGRLKPARCADPSWIRARRAPRDRWISRVEGTLPEGFYEVRASVRSEGEGWFGSGDRHAFELT